MMACFPYYFASVELNYERGLWVILADAVTDREELRRLHTWRSPVKNLLLEALTQQLQLPAAGEVLVPV